MCGIVGAFAPNSLDLVAQALPKLEHRGPDSRGMTDLGPCALGMVRLAIQDPLPRADQPMTRGDLTVVFNGEIYNFRELRGQLSALGHSFTTTGDTEVVLCALLEWGMAALDRFHGMFAIAWWSAASATLHVARDRCGIKPLYWRSVGASGVEFASEVRALSRPESQISMTAVDQFLRFGSPISETIYSDVLELMPGNVLAVSEDRLSISSWIPVRGLGEGLANGAQPIEAFESAIASHLLADRKVAVFLSGGFDSALVARGIRDAGGSPLAITLDTGGNADEVAGAVRTASHYGLEHHVVRVASDDLPTLAADFMAAQDQPTIDGFNTYLVSKAAVSEGCAVALSGLGGDEVLGGYGYYSSALSHRMIQHVPKSLMSKTAGLLEGVTGKPASRLVALAGAVTPVERFVASREVFSADETSQLTGTSSPADLGLKSDHSQSVFRQLQTLDFDTYLRATLLRDSDVFSMWHGLEIRVPMLDCAFVRSAGEHPEELSKRSLAEAAGDPYLMSIANQRKLGFVLPWDTWLPHLIAANVGDLSSADPWHGLVDPDLGCKFVERGGIDPQRTWTLLVLATWLSLHTQGVS